MAANAKNTFTFSRRASFLCFKKNMKKSRQWLVLESSVGVLRLKKCDKTRNFLQKKSWRALKM
jgi:hypothetical protein